MAVPEQPGMRTARGRSPEAGNRLASSGSIRLDWAMKPVVDEAKIFAIERPDESLWRYYLLRCLVFPPLFPLLVLPSWFRYHTMRYQFTTEGISMRWGILFRREIILSYARIQDIHLRSNIVERWLGLARILIQTASGSASAEMTIEGIKEFQELRDFLYSRMRGVKEPVRNRPAAFPDGIATDGQTDGLTTPELVTVLREIKEEMRLLRETVEKAGRSTGGRNV
jgi:uncharacterized protein